MLRFLLLLMLAAPARADDGQVWLQAVVQGPVRGKLVTWLEVQSRLTDGASRQGQFFLRPALGVQVNPRVQVLAGYLYAESSAPGGALQREHRPWQQLLVRVAGTPGGPVLMSRTRLEQRLVEGRDGTGWRLRQFMRGQVPVGDDGWSVLAVAEGFVGLNATGWGQPSGLEQVRLFGGVAKPLTRRLTLEAGYLNQRLIRDSGDRVNHAASISLFYRIG